MLKVWGRNNSSNVQKVMWAVGELGLAHERIDVGGAFGKTREAPYSDMNPNATVPTLEEADGFTLWESNSVVRYLAGKYDASNLLEPKDPKQRALASQWMDWQLSVIGPNITPVFWGLIRTAPDKRDMAAIKSFTEKLIDNMKTLDAQLGKTEYIAGPAFSYGDMPIGVMCFRYLKLVPDRPATPNLDRWYAAISSRQAFKDHVAAVPLT